MGRDKLLGLAIAVRSFTKRGRAQKSFFTKLTHNKIGDEGSGPENHMQWQRDMKVKRVVVEDVDGEKHEDETEVVRQRDGVLLLSPVHLVEEPLQRHYDELRNEQGWTQRKCSNDVHGKFETTEFSCYT